MIERRAHLGRNRRTGRRRAGGDARGYVGVYDLVEENDATNKTTAAITLADGALFLDYNGKGNEELIPLGAAVFSWSGTHLELPTTASGGATLTIHYAEGSESGPRSPR